MCTGALALIEDLKRSRLGSIHVEPAPLIWALEVSRPRRRDISWSVVTRLRPCIGVARPQKRTGLKEPVMANSAQESRTTRPRRDLGAMRTMMAADRTLMAWIRTALSLLSFGFAIYKILQEVEQSGKLLPNQNSPRNVGLIFGIAGTAAMVMGTIEYWQTLHELRQDNHFRQFRPAFIMALVMSVSGLVLIFGMLTNFL